MRPCDAINGGYDNANSIFHKMRTARAAFAYTIYNQN